MGCGWATCEQWVDSGWTAGEYQVGSRRAGEIDTFSHFSDAYLHLYNLVSYRQVGALEERLIAISFSVTLREIGEQAKFGHQKVKVY